MWVAAMPVAAVTATHLVKSALYVCRRLAMMRFSRNDLPVPAFPAVRCEQYGVRVADNLVE